MALLRQIAGTAVIPHHLNKLSHERTLPNVNHGRCRIHRGGAEGLHLVHHFRPTRIEREAETRFQQIPGHRLAHNAQADETDILHS